MLNKLIKHISILLIVVISFSTSAKNNAPIIDMQKPSLAKYLDHHELTKHLKILSSDNYAGRKFSTSASLKAQDYIIAQLRKAQVKPFQQNYRHGFTYETLFSTKQGNNIIGIVEGNTYPESFIVLTAHYDHLGTKQRNIYNGADDNASGVAALLSFATELAKVPLQHSVIFLFTDAEEVHLTGAKAFIQQQKTLLPAFKLNINLDMIAGDKFTRRLRYINKGIEKLLTTNKLESLKIVQAPLKLKKGFRAKRSEGRKHVQWYEASDHSVFYHADIPFIYFGVGTHKNYHTPQDTFSNVNLSFFISASRTIFQQLLFIDKHMNNKPD